MVVKTRTWVSLSNVVFHDPFQCVHYIDKNIKCLPCVWKGNGVELMDKYVRLVTVKFHD